MVFRKLICILKENKKLPYYAAERRIDLLLNLFLSDILTSYYQREVSLIVPEFPLKHEVNRQSYKLDFLCMFHDTKQPIFVELKTDTISFNANQAIMYSEKALDWKKCIYNLTQIISNPKMYFNYRVKYFILLTRLHDCSIINLVEDKKEKILQLLENCTSRSHKSTISRLITNLAINSEDISAVWPSKAKLIYLIPRNDKLRQRILDVCGGTVDVLDFSQIRNLDYAPNTEYADEFSQFIEFLSKL